MKMLTLREKIPLGLDIVPAGLPPLYHEHDERVLREGPRERGSILPL